MILKAGTYTFNNELTIDKEFSQNINIVLSASEGDSSGEFHCSGIGTADNNNMLVVAIYKMVIREGGEEIVEELEEPQLFPIYYNGSFAGDVPMSQTHTITEDTEVADDFGTWYKANTDYDKVNGGETPEEPETPTKKFTRLYLGEVAYSSNGKRFRKLQTEEYVEPSEPEETLEAGLYDADDNLVASWDELVNTYGMDVEKGYTSNSSDSSKPDFVLDNNIELAIGVKLIISNSVTSIGAFAFSYCSSLTSIVIGDSVTSIGSQSFYRCESLTSITIGDSATSISDYAFHGCSSLTSIEVDSNNGYYKSKNGILYSKDEKTLVRCPQKKDGISFEIPNSVTHIGSYAFEECDSLVEVIIPDPVSVIGYYAFKGCTSLTKIEIPDTVTIISNGAFRGCKSLTDVQLPNALTQLGQEAFSGCTKLESIIFEGTVEEWNSIRLGVNWASGVAATYVECIDGKVWLRNQPEGLYDAYGSLVASWDALVNTYGMDCEMDYSPGSAESNYYANVSSSPYCVLTNNSELTDCTELIVGDIEKLGECAFYRCTSLKKIDIPWGINTISDYAFYGCHSLTSIEQAISIKSIGSYAYSNCISLTSIELPEFVENIESHAFQNCKSLTRVTMPKTVKSIGENAFRNCASYFEIYFGGTKAEWEAILKGDNWKPSDKTVYVACTDGVLET